MFALYSNYLSLIFANVHLYMCNTFFSLIKKDELIKKHKKTDIWSVLSFHEVLYMKQDFMVSENTRSISEEWR